MTTCNARRGAVEAGKEKPGAQTRRGATGTVAGALAALKTHRRDTLLEAVAVAARELLRSSDLSQSLSKVIARIGAAAGVDRTHFFLIDNSANEGRILEHYIWALPDVPTPPAFSDMKEPMVAAGFKSWIPRLERGETIVAHPHELLPKARALLELGGVKSILCVPVFTEGRWLGLIAFDDCRGEREWLPIEIDAIKALAELVGAAIARASHLEELAAANRFIENSSTILYRLGPQPPYPLIYLSKNTRRYGYEIDELLTSPTDWQQRVNRDDMPAVIANLKSVTEGRTNSIRAEFRFRKKDGSWVWFEDSGRAVRDAEGRLIAIEGILNDITERKEATRRRDAILEAVAASADELLRSSDLQLSLPKVIEWIGRATGVDRAHIFEIDPSTPAARVLQHHMWSAPGVPTLSLLTSVKGMAMADVGFGPWLPRLAKGEIIVGHVRDFEPSVRELFNRLGTQSVLTVPVQFEGRWWGHLGFDDCRTDREWSSAEIDTLKTLAELVGAAVARTVQMKTLGDANRIVENSPTILYRLSANPPFCNGPRLVNPFLRHPIRRALASVRGRL